MPETRGLCLSEEQTVTTVRICSPQILAVEVSSIFMKLSVHWIRIDCISLTMSQILRRPKIGAGYRMIDMVTEPHRLIRRCEVTAILVLYGLPR